MTFRMNDDGDMDKYFNKTMTIDEIVTKCGYECYIMVEDHHYWTWHDNMINHKATAPLGVYKRF
jgi:hypothetical protein